MQISSVTIKLFSQQMTEEGHSFPDSNPEKLLERENEVLDETIECKIYFQ